MDLVYTTKKCSSLFLHCKDVITTSHLSWAGGGSSFHLLEVWCERANHLVPMSHVNHEYKQMFRSPGVIRLIRLFHKRTTECVVCSSHLGAVPRAQHCVLNSATKHVCIMPSSNLHSYISVRNILHHCKEYFKNIYLSSGLIPSHCRKSDLVFRRKKHFERFLLEGGF